MAIRSMTGYAQVKSQASDGNSFTLSLKSVNHRFLDPQLRLPPEMEELEMKIRRVLKERLARGHVEVTLNVVLREGEGFQLNRTLVAGYVGAFRKAAAEFGTVGEPDLNMIFRIPGALGGAAALNGDFAPAVMAGVDHAIERLNVMREDVGRGMEARLSHPLDSLTVASQEVGKLRAQVTRAYMEQGRSRLQELQIGRAHV